MANKKRPHNGLNQTSGGSAVGGAVSGGTTSAAPRHPQKFYHYLARHDLAPRGLAQQYKQQAGGHPDWSGFNPFTMVDPDSPYLSETPHLKGRKLDKFNAWMQAANGAAGTPGTTGPGAGTGIDPGSGFAGGFTAGSPGDGISNVGAGSPTDPSNFLGISFNYGPGPYVGNGGTTTTMPQPLVDALAPTFPFQSRPGGAGGADSPTGDGGGGDEEGDPIDDPTEPDGPGGQGGGGGGGQHHKKKKNNNNNNNHKKNNHHNGGHGGNNHHRNNNGGHSGLRRPANPAHPNAPHLGGNNNNHNNNNNNHKKRK